MTQEPAYVVLLRAPQPSSPDAIRERCAGLPNFIQATVLILTQGGGNPPLPNQRVSPALQDKRTRVGCAVRTWAKMLVRAAHPTDW